MIVRLALALLIALLPLPASAGPACHAPPAPAADAAHHHHRPAKQEPARAAGADQLCIGCVAPASVRAPQLAQPPAFARSDAPPAERGGVALTANPPATPPPRSEA